MNKQYYFAALFAMMGVAQTQAQNVPAVGDSYDAATLATQDLNGTARYVGMGGAMEALGADLSTIGSNPAGIGMFRSNQVSTSFGLVSQQDAMFNPGAIRMDGNKTNASFDQIGFVIADRTGRSSFANFAFNYHKSRNFNQILSAADRLNGSSQNLQTVLRDMNGVFNKGNGNAYSQLDDLYMGHLVLQPVYDQNGNPMMGDDGKPLEEVVAYGAEDYQFDRANKGYIGSYDFAFSGNINNRVYLGLTIGISDVHYKSSSEYFENLQNNQDNITDVLVSDRRSIHGTGYDVKAGVIFRPIETSPFRIGLSVASPTFYRLTMENSTAIGNFSPSTAAEDFRFNTPWKFGLSLGHTIGRELALGASYEYADYSACDMRMIDDSYSYYRDDIYGQTSTSDRIMKYQTENTLKGVSTLKLGAEYKPDKNLALRLGYNHVTPMFQKEAVRDQTIDSPGVYYASSTDYTNWGATDRITAGVGFTFDQFRFDLAYQYSQRSGDFYPFMKNYSASFIDADNVKHTEVNQCNAVKVNDKRHQLLCTLSYNF